MRSLLIAALLSAGCAVPEVPSNAEGAIGGRTPVLGGGGFAYETPRVGAGDGSDFQPYTFFLELTGTVFDPMVSLESLEFEERHAIAQAVGLADRLSFSLSLPGVDEELRGRGSVYTVSHGEGAVRLEFGSDRADGETAGTEDVRPINVATDVAWTLTVDELDVPEAGVGRVVGSLELVITRNTIDSDDSLVGRTTISFDVPLLGSWMGQCQASLLLRPEGQDCPR